DYAMGIALSELYKKALDTTKRIENAAERKARVLAIEAQYKEPAIRHLRASLGNGIEAPAYVEGLLDLYDGRLDAAREKARAAFEAAPWLYEAKKLEGDVLFTMGSKYRHDAAFDYAKMTAWFRQAEDAYRTAVDV